MTSSVSPPPLAEAGDGDPYLAASAAVRGFCGWHIAPSETQIIVLDGSCARDLMLPSLYVTAVISVTEDDVLLDPSSYSWSAKGWLRKPWGQRWTGELRGVVVEMTHGYDIVPADIVEKVTSIAARAAASPSGHVSVSQGSTSVTNTQIAPGVAGGVALLQFEQDALARYRIPVEF